MTGYVKFRDGHREEILEGYTFDDPECPRSLHHIVVQTHSGCYKKTIHKDSKYGRVGATECVGYAVMTLCTQPVAFVGHNGIVDIVVDNQTTYAYEIRNGAWNLSGIVAVPKNADVRDIHSAIMNEFEGVRIFEV